MTCLMTHKKFVCLAYKINKNPNQLANISHKKKSKLSLHTHSILHPPPASLLPTHCIAWRRGDRQATFPSITMLLFSNLMCHCSLINALMLYQLSLWAGSLWINKSKLHRGCHLCASLFSLERQCLKIPSFSI